MSSFHFLWHLLYDKLAFMFDFVSGRVSKGRWKRWGCTSVSYVRGRRVLELGHGPGHLLIELKRSGFQPTGVDLSRGMGKLTARRLRRAGIHVPLVRCRAQALPFRESSFDAAVAAFPTDDLLKVNTLKEVARVIPQGGRLAMVVGAQRDGSQPNGFFVEWLKGFIGRDGTGKGTSPAIFPLAGFRARIESRSVDGSPVILLIAEKWQRKDGRVNMPPTVQINSIVKLRSKEYCSKVVEGRAIDADGDTLIYRWLRDQTVLRDWCEVGEDGKLSLDFRNLPPLKVGEHTLTLEVSDPYEIVRDTLDLIIENSPPVIMSMGVITSEANRMTIISTRISDYDGDKLYYLCLEEETVLASGSVRAEKGGNPVHLEMTISDLTPGAHTVRLQVSDGINPPVSHSARVAMNVSLAG